MEPPPPLQNILTELRKKADGLAILRKADFHCPPQASMPDEIAAVGLALVDACRNEDFWNICLSKGIRSSYSSDAQPCVDAGLQRYVIPLLRYAQRELKRADAAYMPARIAERKFDDVILGPCIRREISTDARTSKAYLCRVRSPPGDSCLAEPR
jgi:hypothetical protein